MNHADAIKKCIADQIGSWLYQDVGTLIGMGVDSFDAVELLMRVEDSLGIEIPDPADGFRALMAMTVDEFVEFCMQYAKTVPDEL